MARNFNGSTDYILTENSSGFSSISNPWTIALQFYPTVATGSTLFSTAINSNPFDGIWVQWGPGFGVGNPNQSIIVGAVDASSLGWSTHTTTTYALNTWWSLIATADGSGNSANARIYINGVLASLSAVSNNTGPFVNRVFSIGATTDGGAKFTGRIGEVGVWPSVLNTSAIMALGAGLPVAFVPNNLLSIALDGVSSPELDRSGNFNHGILHGTSYADHPLQVQYPRSFLGPIEDQVWSTLIAPTVVQPVVQPWAEVGINPVRRRIKAIGYH